jgi:hypothetical protein
MEYNETKSAISSLGIIAPVVAVALYFIQWKYSIEVPVAVAGYSVDIVTSVISGLVLVGAWGRWRAKRIIDRWFP